MASATLAFDILTRYKDRGADKAAKDMDRVGKSSHRMSSGLKRAAVAGMAGLSFYAVGKGIASMTKNAMQDEAAQRKMAIGIKNATGATNGQIASVEKWISKQGVALGITDDELRPAFQRLVQATGDIGKAQRLSGIAMDASAGSGKSLKTVTEAIAKAQNGNMGSLSRLGVKIKDARGHTLSFDKAMQGMAKTFKGQAEARAGTLEGKMGRLRLVLDETKEAIGARLIPAVTVLATWFLERGLPAVQKFGGEFKREVLPTLTTFGKFVGEQVVPRVVDLAKWLGKNRDVVIPLVGAIAAGVVVFKTITAVTRAWAVAQGILNTVMAMNPVGLVVVAVAALAAGVVIAYKRSETFRRIVQGAWKVIGTAARLYWNVYLKPVFTVLRAAFGLGATAARNMKEGIGKAWDGIKDKARSSVRWVVDKMLWMAEKVLDLADKAFGWAPGIGDNLKKAREKVTKFRDDMNRTLSGIKDEPVKVTVKGVWINGVKMGAPSAVVGRAKGGPITGGVPGRDSVLGALMPGEHVLTTDEVRRAGGHRGVYAIRRMLKRGEFAPHGDVPAFAGGGPVFSLSAARPNLGGLRNMVTRGALQAARAVQEKMRAILKSLGGAGSLTPSQIARGQRFARSQVGDPYVWGGVGPNGFDCSGFVGAVLNAAQGRNPYSRRGSTGTMPWPGFSPGLGSFSAGWYTGSPGHMAGRIGGMGIESAGGVGVRIGRAATSVTSFPNVAHYDKGGMLQPGWTLAYNGTGRPEKVTAPGGRDDLHVHLYIDGREVHQSLLKVRREKRRPLGLE